MSIKGKSIGDTPDISWGNAYVIGTSSPDRLFGRLCEVIETMGLQSKQEEATKNLIRKTIWEVFQDGLWIESEEHNELRKKNRTYSDCPVPSK